MSTNKRSWKVIDMALLARFDAGVSDRLLMIRE